MATCDMGYDHESAAQLEPEVIVTQPATSENDVEIAKIEAKARVETERLYTEQRANAEAAELVALRARVEAQDAELSQLRGPTAVVIAPESEPEPEPEPVVDETIEPEPPEVSNPTPVVSEKKRKGWWDAYRG